MGRSLTALGYNVQEWPDWTWLGGGVCVLMKDITSGVITGGADPRRTGYVVGW